MLSSMHIADSVETFLTAASQEILALALFAASFAFFRYFNIKCGYRGPHKGKQVFLAEPSKKNATPRPHDRSNGGSQQQAPRGRVQEAESQIMKLLELREFTAALNAYRTFEREGLDRFFTNEAMYGGFIQSAVRIGKLDVVERMMRMMTRNRIVPSIDFWHSLLKLLSSRKHYSTCRMLYTTYGHLLPNDKVIFSCLINAALESGAPESASAMLARYRQCGLEPADHVTSFRTYVATGDVASAEKLFWELEGNLTPLMFNLVLLAHINATQPQRAMSLLTQAHHFEMKHAPQKIVDTVSYNTVIKGFVASGDVERAFKCLECLRSHNLQPDDVTLTSLLEISLAAKKHGVTDQLVQMLLDGAQTRSPETPTCNLFMKGLIREGRVQKAVEVYETLKNCNGSQPNIVTYSILIKALVDSRELENALYIVRDMQSAGMAPDEIIVTHLLEGCRLLGKHELGEQIFEDMLAAGVKPSDYTLTMMVKLHGRCGAHEKAYKLVETWEERHAMKPSVIHYTCVMSGCLRTKRYDLAWAAYELMEKDGVVPDEMMMATLVPAMVSSQRFGCVLHLARRSLRWTGGIRAHAVKLNKALAQMLAIPNAQEHAQELKLLMQTAGIAITGRSVASRFPPKRAAS